MTTIALITGANKGIGFETARLLGSRGMTVLAAARDEARAGRRSGRCVRWRGCRFVQLDVTDEKSAQAAAERGSTASTAGWTSWSTTPASPGRRPGRPARPLATVREVYETNVFGVVAVTNAMLPLLRRAPAARIVNVSSEVGSITSMTDPESPLARWPRPALPVVQDRAEHGHRHVREGAEGHPDQSQRGQPRLLRHRSQRHRGFRTPEQGAEVSVALATLAAGGPTGMLWGHLWTTDGPGEDGVLPW